MSTLRAQDLFQKLLEGKISRREFTTRAASFGVSAGAIAAFLQACGGSPQASNGGTTTINLWHGWTGGDNTQTLNIVLKQYTKDEQGKQNVNPTALPWDDLFSKLVTSFAAGSPPDVTMMHQSEMPEYIKRGILLPIDEQVKNVSLNLSSLPQATMKNVQSGGKLYGVPGDLHPLGMYYNTDMVSAAGLDPKKPPTNQDEFLHWVDKLTLRSGSNVTQYGLYIQSTGAVPRWIWFSLMYQFGGAFLGGDGKSDVNSDASHKALQFIVDLFRKYKVVTPGATNQSIDPAAAKKAAVWFIGPWEVNLRMQQKLNFATTAVPVIGTQPAAWANAHCLTIVRQKSDSKYSADATFIKWFFDHYATAAKVVGVIPLSPAAQNSQEFTAAPQYPYYKPFIGELNHVAMEPAVPQYTSIFSFGKPTPLSTNLEAAIAGSKSVDQALADMKQGIDSQLAQPY